LDESLKPLSLYVATVYEALGFCPMRMPLKSRSRQGHVQPVIVSSVQLSDFETKGAAVGTLAGA
jgi:hypothetical protein